MKTENTKTRRRMTAFELYQSLVEHQTALQAKHDAKMAQLSARIQRIYSKHEAIIQVERLRSSFSMDELEAQTLELKQKIKYLRQAAKAKNL